MSEEFSFDIDLDEIDKLEVLDKMQKELEARHQRFMNGTETIDDLINHIYHYKIKNNDGLDLELVEKKYYEKIVDLYNKEKEKNKELEKYDYRKIKLDEKDRISSIHFTKEQLDLMNLGIALYVGIPKILADKEDEETDI